MVQIGAASAAFLAPEQPQTMVNEQAAMPRMKSRINSRDKGEQFLFNRTLDLGRQIEPRIHSQGL